MKHPQRPGFKESVWDYPELPKTEPCNKCIQIRFAGLTIANSTKAVRVSQRGIPPVYYLPPEDVKLEYLNKTNHHSFCHLKGQADYYSVTIGKRIAKNAAWSYQTSLPEVTPGGYVAFYAHLMDVCQVGNETVHAPPWVWLGGWGSSATEGPFISPETFGTFNESTR